jgi:hypothetical protein
MPNVEGGIVEYFGGKERKTLTAGGTITGGQLVALNGNRQVVAAGAASNAVLGVALHNAVSGEKVTVASDGVWPITASGAIAAGDTLIAAAAGAVSTAGAAPDARQVVGRALDAISNGVAGRVQLLLT